MDSHPIFVGFRAWECPNMAVSDALETVEDRLIDALEASARGPAQNGVFALWLLVRSCRHLTPPDALEDRLHLQRLEKMERRLSSLSLPGSLRRAVTSGLRTLRAPTADTPCEVLTQLVAPASQVVSPAMGQAIGRAAREAQRAARAP